jgi:hypothetical protein
MNKGDLWCIMVMNNGALWWFMVIDFFWYCIFGGVAGRGAAVGLQPAVTIAACCLQLPSHHILYSQILCSELGTHPNI